MQDFLEKIVEHKKKLNEQKKTFYTSVKQKLDRCEYTRYKLFKKQISKKGKINLIAEIKKASPSKGLIRQHFDLMAIADTYAKNGAAAISVLTEDKFFLGRPEYVRHLTEHYKVPVLTKDFIIDEGQIYEARYDESSAILLIAAILNDDQIKKFKELADLLDLDCLVEVHDEVELERVLKLDCEIIGINNRNLHTFEVDLKTCEQLIPMIPKDKVVVAESGIKTHQDILMLKELGANAVLIGETFMREEDIGRKMKEVMEGK